MKILLLCWGHNSVLEGLPRMCEDQISRVILSYTVTYRLAWVIGESVWKNERGRGRKEEEKQRKRKENFYTEGKFLFLQNPMTLHKSPVLM